MVLVRAVVLSLVALVGGFATQAALFPRGGADASLPPNLFADPRDYGTPHATCGSGSGASTWNANNSTNDDAPGVQAALNTGLPVVIPFPGCKFVTQVAAPAAGATLFAFAGPGPYDALTGSFPALTSPYIFVPDAATGATNNCIFDTKGYEGVAWRYITVIGNSMFNGTSAFCNSVGIANGRPQAFATLDHVSITNMAGIGGAADSTCQPAGTLDVPVFQLDINDLKMGHDCFGIYGNYSDVFATNVIMGNIWNSCIASPTGGGIAISVNNLRCEFTGHFDANPIYRDGVAIYISTSGFAQLSNIHFDHILGACIAFDGNNGGQNAGWSSASNILCKDPGVGGPAGGGGVITNQCSFVFENTPGFISGTGISSQGFTSVPQYNLCFVGTQGFNITWQANSADCEPGGGGGACHIAFISGTLPTFSSITAPNYGTVITDTAYHYTQALPTSCSGLATGTLRNNSGVVNVCP